MELTTVLANLLATGCALLLMRRGPSRRLKRLILTVGLISLSQTAALLHVRLMAQASLGGLFELAAAVLSCYAVYLLGLEIVDRNFTSWKLRLMATEASRGAGRASRATEPDARADQHIAPAVEPHPNLVTADASRLTRDLLGMVRIIGTRDELDAEKDPTRPVRDTWLR